MNLPCIESVCPQVSDILRDARGCRGLEEKDETYSRLKNRLSRYVGGMAENELLQSCNTYDTALQAMVDALDY